MKNKKRIVGFLVLLEIVSVFLALKSFNNKIVKLDNIMLKQSVINKAKFGLYIEQTNGSYEESNSSSWPTSMILNMERSTCVDEDGSTINNTLEWDRVNKKVTLNSNTTAYCYLYFDYMFHGLGTQERKYEIRSIEDLVDLSILVNGGETYTGSYFIMTRDLDFNQDSSYENSLRTEYGDLNDDGSIESIKIELTKLTGKGFTPIAGVNGTQFEGTFDGDNNTLSNLYINNSTLSRVGLFGKVNNSTLKNLTLSGNIKSSVDSNTAGLIATSYGSLNISNIENNATIVGSSTGYGAGGIISRVRGNVIIEDSINNGNVTCTNTGGIIAQVTNGAVVTFDNVENNGTITGNGPTAGLVGFSYEDPASTITIKNSRNNGQVSSIPGSNSEYTATGGLVGSTHNIIIENSYNTGDITSQNPSTVELMAIGGLLGVATTATIVNSFNTGNILCSTNCYVAGLIWQISTSNGRVSILNSYNAGNLTSYRDGPAGILGHIASSTSGSIINSYNLGNIVNTTSSITGTRMVGGILYHSAASDAFKLNNVYTAGSMSSDSPNATLYGVGYFSGASYSVTNVYYLSGSYTQSNQNINAFNVSLADMQTQTFVNTLNTNVNNINLSSIDSSLSEYSLKTWKLGSSGYPVFDD